MSGKFIFFFVSWLLCFLAGFSYLERHAFTALPFFVAAFVFGVLLVKQFLLERAVTKKRSPLSGSECSVEASPANFEADESVSQRSSSQDTTGSESGENSLRVKAEFICEMCIGLGATPAVDSFIAGSD